jgi:hypothetical protein
MEINKWLEENKAIPEDMIGKVCMHCLAIRDDIKPIMIIGMGYGSIFDSTKTQIDLCDDCKALKPKEWWDMKEVITYDDGEDFKFYKIEFENEIYEFILTCPNAGKELFFNRYDREYYMEPQDWIDYELKILPHEKCKEYGRYSPQEIDAYRDRFPVCEHVFVNVYHDGSSNTWCYKNASVSGKSDGSCSVNIGTGCFGCASFKVREKDTDLPVRNISEEFYEREIKRLTEEIRIKMKNLQDLKNRK